MHLKPSVLAGFLRSRTVASLRQPEICYCRMWPIPARREARLGSGRRISSKSHEPKGKTVRCGRAVRKAARRRQTPSAR